MKVEVQFVGESIDTDTYTGEDISWVYEDGQVHIYTRTRDKAPRVASYPEGRVVRIRVIE